MTTTDPWPFGTDADRDDPLTALRIAVTSSHPGWYYLVAFDRESEARPTDAEAKMLQSFLWQYKEYWYRPSYLVKLSERPLDVDGGANGVIFHKFGTDDWGYRRASFDRGWLWSVIPPWMRSRPEYADHPRRGPYSLLALMDSIHKYSAGKWEAWKAEHPEVFGGAP